MRNLAEIEILKMNQRQNLEKTEFKKRASMVVHSWISTIQEART
jgi:hypothetical protein